MTHKAIHDIAAELEIQSGAVVSKVIHRDDHLNVTVFGFDVGQELTEHSGDAECSLVTRSSDYMIGAP